jgi:hypothetical protein
MVPVVMADAMRTRTMAVGRRPVGTMAADSFGIHSVYRNCLGHGYREELQ